MCFSKAMKILQIGFWRDEKIFKYFSPYKPRKYTECVLCVVKKLSDYRVRKN